MSYTPVKGSPRPPVPGNNPIEAALAEVEYLVNQIPLDPSVKQVLATVGGILNGVVQSVDPLGQKAQERTDYLNQLDAAKDWKGIADFCTTTPARPTPWVRLGRWMCVQGGQPDPLPGGP